MARRGGDRDPRTGELLPGGARSIFFDAAHGTGSFDPRMDDPDFLAGREAVPKRRAVVPLSVDVRTIEGLDVLSQKTNMSRGRVVDKLVSIALKEFAEHEHEQLGKKKGRHADDDEAPER